MVCVVQESSVQKPGHSWCPWDLQGATCSFPQQVTSPLPSSPDRSPQAWESVARFPNILDFAQVRF